MSNCVKTKKNSLLPIQINNLAFKTPTRNLISKINLRINSKTISVIMGPNGSGKSIFLRIIHGLITPSTGSFSFNGETINKAIKKRQSMVFQKPTLLRRTVWSNLIFVDSLDKKVEPAKCKSILKKVGLEHLINHPAQLLSGGEQQRLALARALITKPDLLLLDEPTANLDPTSISVIENIVKNASDSNVKVIFVTHDIRQARRLGSDIIFFHNGQVTEHTDTKIFFDKPFSREAKAFLDGEIMID